MTELHRIGRLFALVAALLTGFVLAAPTHATCQEDAGGIGGTGHAPSGKSSGKSGSKDRGGIGGTGRSEPDPGGVGGTGRREGDSGGVGGTGLRSDAGGVGGTGIVGVITGFGSVCVNGLEVEYDASTPVEADGASAHATSLAVGQVVVIDAADRDGVLHADRIAVRNVAVGPVARIDAAHGELEVLGQRVQLDRATRLADQGGGTLAASDIKAGSFVAVSGLRRGDGSVVATRVETIAPRELVSVTGPLAVVAPHRASLAGLAIEAPASSALHDFASRVTLVIGRLDPASGALQAQRIAPAVDFAKGHERVSIEGLVQGPTPDGFRTEHADVDTSGLAAGARSAATGARVVVTGALEPGGRIRAERVEVLVPDRSSIRDPARVTRDSAGAAHEEPEDHEDEDEVEHGEHVEQAEEVEHEDHAERADEVEHGEQAEHAETPEQVEHQETPEQPETVERPEEPEHAESPEHADTPEMPEVGESAETPEHVERPETPEAPEQVERPETPEVPEQVERPAAPELPEVERPETPEVPEQIERPEAPERPEVERPETPELPEVERPEAPERPEIERPEHDD